MEKARASIDVLKLISETLAAHPVATAFGIAAIGVAAALGIFFLFLLWGGLGDTLKEAWKLKRDEKLIGERDRALELKDAAEAALKELIAEGELLKTSLQVAAAAAKEANRQRATGDKNARLTYMVHVCDWVQRLFGFLRPDINKVILWVPHNGALRVHAYNGITPEAASTLSLPIESQNAHQDTFAATAFRRAETQVCDDVTSDPRYNPLGRPPTHPYAAIIAAPIVISGEVRGVVTVDSLHKGAFAGKTPRQLAELSASLLGLFMI